VRVLGFVVEKEVDRLVQDISEKVAKMEDCYLLLDCECPSPDRRCTNEQYQVLVTALTSMPNINSISVRGLGRDDQWKSRLEEVSTKNNPCGVHSRLVLFDPVKKDTKEQNPRTRSIDDIIYL